ncbi:hypothetical protein ACFXG4_08535 [Nocardia sp. NPDC059246]|uniref:DUF7171 family protein n=1 Tax=unclassified Nocardia TaxID=2637762 RepID=UPI0036A27728
MAKVTRHNGTKGTAEGFTRYNFLGMPTDQFEHRPEIGEIRSMSVTVECTGSGYEQIAEGVRHKTKWKVTNATLGETIERPRDPELPFEDEDEDDSATPGEARTGAEYGDYTAPAEAEGGNVVSFSDRSDNA